MLALSPLLDPANRDDARLLDKEIHLTAGTWRTVFWTLAGFGALMLLSALGFIPETLSLERGHGGGCVASSRGSETCSVAVPFVAHTLTATFSGFMMMGYIANSSYVLQG